MVLLKFIILLLGVALIAIGVRSILKREAKFGWSDEDGHRVVEGIPAVIVGLLEIAVGFYVLIYQRTPTLF